MASSFEKSVKGATKIKLAPPKSKYVEHILIATHAGEHGTGEVFRALQNRLRDSTWTIVFKALIVVHLMIREGEQDVTLRHLSKHPRRQLAINNFTEVQTQGRNIRDYSDYLIQRAISYETTKVDYVRGGEGRLMKMSVDKGLLRETESVQDCIQALLRCELLSSEAENEITLCAFRLLTMDLLVLFHVMNEGTINILGHYFEMSKPDAQRALSIYRTFVKQTDQVVQFLSVARLHEHSTRLEIPKIKHAPTKLAADLENYVNDKDFEINRRQYIAQAEAKKRSGKSNGDSMPFGDSKPSVSKAATGQSFPDPKPSSSAPVEQKPAGPAPDLIDFFASIEQNQTTMATQPGQQQYQQQPFQMAQSTGFVQQQQQQQQQQQPYGFQQPQQQQAQPFPPQSTNPFGQPQQQQQPQPQPLQPDFTGAGFGGYGPQPGQQQTFGMQQPGFASIPENGVPQYQQQQQQQQQQMPQQQQFSPTQPDPLQQQSTNPFRQSMMPSPTGAQPAFNNSAPPQMPLTTGVNRSATNPFAKHSTPQMTGMSTSTTSGPFTSTPSTMSPQSTTSPFQSQAPQPQSIQSQPTGTNPFAWQAAPSMSQQQGAQPQPSLIPNATGSTNPFRQSAFVNQQTGQGWQQSNQGTMGGLEGLDTIPVFPRPGQPQQQGQSGQPGWS